jgi:hypothetical protein
MKTREQQLRRIRILIAIVIAGLISSGLSTFPLLRESGRLDHFVHAYAFPPFIQTWIAHVHEGLAIPYAAYPFIAYGTDWLGFGHFVVALFLIGAFVDPVRNVWIIRASMIACVLVVPTALICGATRGIPLWWRIVDSSFGIVGLIPLWLADRMIRRLPN